ncbi:hypothetical protein B0H19DRAFT_1068309 [Mycena capillaripes]|nr:hypothetical protein B0H19DRAFT_1068309 [Mycena capillaripes]
MGKFPTRILYVIDTKTSYFGGKSEYKTESKNKFLELGIRSSLTVVFAAAPFVSGWWEPSVNSGASAKFVGKVTSNAVSAEGLLGHVPAGGRTREPGGQVAMGYGISGDERSLNGFRQTEKLFAFLRKNEGRRLKMR